MTPLSVIHLAPESMAQVETFQDYIADQLESGSIDPLDVYIRCIAMEKTMAACKEVLVKYATQEAQKHNGGKEFEKHSFKIKVGEVGVKYLFDNCNDPVLQLRESQFDIAKKTVDERKAFLKTIKEPLRVVDEETGDSYVINPAPKSSTTSVIVTIK